MNYECLTPLPYLATIHIIVFYRAVATTVLYYASHMATPLATWLLQSLIVKILIKFSLFCDRIIIKFVARSYVFIK